MVVGLLFTLFMDFHVFYDFLGGPPFDKGGMHYIELIIIYYYAELLKLLALERPLCRSQTVDKGFEKHKQVQHPSVSTITHVINHKLEENRRGDNWRNFLFLCFNACI